VSQPWRPLWVASLGVGLLACLSLLVIPVETTAWVAVARGASLVAVVVFAFSVVRLPAGVRGIWWMVWTYEALTLAGDVIYDVQERVLDEAPFPGPADALYLGAYVAAFTALLMLVRRVHPGRDREAWIDTMIVTVAVAAIVAMIVLVPTMRDSADEDLGSLIALLYPLLDIVMLSGLIRLLVGGGSRNPALYMLVAAFTLVLAADLVYNALTSNDLDSFSPAWLDALYLASLVVMTAAASAPGAASIDATSSRHPRSASPVRTLGLTLGVLTIPVILLYVGFSENNTSVALLSAAACLVILLVLWRVRRLLAMVAHQSQLLAAQARTDPLTGIANRRTLDYELERLDGAPDAAAMPLTVAMLDLDHFKDFNDRYGHSAGDDVLVRSTRAWRDTLGDRGFLARYGGEEFTVLLPGVGLVQARDLMESVRLATPDGVTVSVGLAERLDHEPGIDVLHRADEALYIAKEAGRDRIATA
jgi:diguanylate cyclase (GGDEF)-like protein